MSENLIEFNNISKFFGKVIALKDVTMKLKKGEIMCLLGDNGAGKSTLIKTLAGVHKPDEGEIIIEGYGSAIGAAFGALIFGTVSMGIFYTDVDTDWFKVFLGAMMLIAVVFNNYVRKRVTESK